LPALGLVPRVEARLEPAARPSTSSGRGHDCVSPQALSRVGIFAYRYNLARGEGDLFQPRATDLGEGAGDGSSAAAPVEVARGGVVEQSPHDQAVELAHVERVAAALEQVLAEPQPLIDRIEIEFVDLALERPPLARA